MDRALAESSRRNIAEGEAEEESCALRIRVKQVESRAKEETEALRKEIEVLKMKLEGSRNMEESPQGEESQAITAVQPDRLTRLTEENRRLRADNARLFNKVARLQAGGNKTSTVATQTEKSAWQTRNDQSSEKIRARIDSVRDFDEFKETLNVKWPREVFRAVRELEGNPIKEDVELNIAIWPDRDLRTDKGYFRQLAERFPDLLDLSEEEKNGGEPFYLVHESSKVTKDGHQNRKKRTVTSLNVGETLEETYRSFTAWREKLMELGISRVAFPVPDRGWEIHKKILEYVLCGTDIAVMAYFHRDRTQKKPTSMEPPPTKGETRPRKKPQLEDAVVISSTGTPYVEVLRRVKQSIDINKIGVKIKNVRCTRRGELLLTVNKEGNGGNVLKEEIQKTLGEHGFQARTGKRDEMVLHIKGLEATTSTEEVKATVMKEWGIRESDIRLSSMRPAFGGTQNLTLSTDRETGDKMVKAGYIQIGWATCKVTERIEIQRCNKCWRTGHLARSCRENEDRSKSCLRCAKAGHIAKDCQNELFCPLCNRTGHRADNMACPEFRSAVAGVTNRRGTLPTRKVETNQWKRSGRWTEQSETREEGLGESSDMVESDRVERAINDYDARTSHEEGDEEDNNSVTTGEASEAPDGPLEITDDLGSCPRQQSAIPLNG